MNRVITVKGTGNVRLKPDLTVVSMTLKTVDKDYDRSMQQAAVLLERLREYLLAVGQQDLKTTSFRVCTERENRRDPNGDYSNVFVGYACVHCLKLEFAFDIQMLSKVLGAIAHCVADPELSIQFTVKDKEAVNEALLKSAASQARRKAEILAEAAGVALGQLVSIDYNWGELNVCSPTAFSAKRMTLANSEGLHMEPEDIVLEDSAAFVWEIRTP